MNKVVILDGVGTTSLTDNHYLASGGEADVYLKDGVVFKLYHDVDRMIAPQKIKELARIGHANVVCPGRLVFSNKARQAIGFTMPYVGQAEPLVRFFAKSFKKQKGLDCGDMVNLIGAMAQTVEKIHLAGCLLVDMNELNVLVGGDLKTPWFIDTDSYQTPSFKATAIADGIRDRKSPMGVFTTDTDWFSFAVLAFQLCFGIHPYKGGHPRYKPSEWLKRMDHGVSVFSPEATLPPSAEPFSTAPPPLLDWFQWVFRDGGRGKPPNFVGLSPAIHVASRPVQTGSAHFKVKREFTLPEPVVRVFSFYGILYVVTVNGLYKNGKCLLSGINGKRLFVAMTPSGAPVLVDFDGEEVRFRGLDQKDLGTTRASSLFCCNGAVYSFQDTHLQEHLFTEVNGRTIRRTRVAATLNSASTRMFDGVFFRRLMGRTWITLPTSPGHCMVLAIPELDDYRLVDARAEENICMVLVERRGKWQRVDLHFNKQFTSYKVRLVETEQKSLNFTVLSSGICAAVCEDGVLELWTSFNHSRLIDNAPVDMSCELFQHDGGVWQISGNQCSQLSMSG